jgi:cation transport regulator ChaB
MATPGQTEVEFPKSQRDLYPTEAQQLYVETYKQSFADSAKGNSGQLSHESVASRDAWEAVKRQYEEDPVTHKWRAIGGQVDVPAKKDSLLGVFMRMIKR